MVRSPPDPSVDDTSRSDASRARGVAGRARRVAAGTRGVAGRARRVTARVLFGDDLGVVVFLASLAFVALYWRVGIFINDSYAVGNTLVNVAEGRLAVVERQYSLTFGSQPGLSVVDGTVYGRNYGHAFLALPLAAVFSASTALFDPALLLAGAWSLLLVGLFERAGRVLGHHRRLTLAGGGVGFLTFLGNAAVAAPLREKWVPFAALQLSTMLAAAFAGVVLYRLLARAGGRRVGAAFGLGLAVASPFGFWASVPKRHALTGLAVALVLACFYWSRGATDRRRALTYRGGAYAVVAVTAWVHAPEALFVLVALGPVDLLTARTNRPRDLAVLAVVFLVALTPFVVTNLLIAGNPFQPPRMLPEYGSGGDGGAGTTATAVSTPRATGRPAAGFPSRGPVGVAHARSPSGGPPGGGHGPGDGAGGGAAVVVLAGLWRQLLAVFETVVGLLVDAVGEVVAHPERLYYTFVRSGRMPASVGVDYAAQEQEAIELTLLESAPALGLLVTAPLLAGRRLHALATAGDRVETVRAGLNGPGRATDLLAGTVVAVFALVYLSRLPTHAQITVRYLVPLLPALLYGVGRLGVTRAAVAAGWPLLVGGWLGTAVLAGAGFLLVHASLALAVGEAMQLHALVALAGVAPLAFAGTASAVTGGERWARLTAASLGAVFGLSTVFLLSTGLFYFPYGQYALPVVRVLRDLLPVAV